MKECPVCKNTYTDDSLRFCLADGASLISIGGEPETLQIQADKKPLRINIPNETAPTNFSPAVSPNQPAKRSFVPFIVVGFLGLLFLGIAAVAALVLLNPFGESEVAEISNTAKTSEMPSIKQNNQNVSQTINARNNEIKEKLADLEKQIQNQKNQRKVANTQPFPAPAQNNPAQPTARVAPTNDGFLSLRTEPSVKTGTQLIKIPSGATVNLENCEQNAVMVDGRRGRWCLVSYGGETGWAFDAWLVY